MGTIRLIGKIRSPQKLSFIYTYTYIYICASYTILQPTARRMRQPTARLDEFYNARFCVYESVYVGTCALLLYAV